MFCFIFLFTDESCERYRVFWEYKARWLLFWWHTTVCVDRTRHDACTCGEWWQCCSSPHTKSKLPGLHALSIYTLKTWSKSDLYSISSWFIIHSQFNHSYIGLTELLIFLLYFRWVMPVILPRTYSDKDELSHLKTKPSSPPYNQCQIQGSQEQRNYLIHSKVSFNLP